jgi:hypothetical protein
MILVAGVAAAIGRFIYYQRMVAEIGCVLPHGYLGDTNTPIPDVGSKEKSP